MAAPTINLVDATGLSRFWGRDITMKIANNPKPFILDVSQKSQAESFSNSNRWQITTPILAKFSSKVNSRNQPTVTQKQAHVVTIATFPASYKERTSNTSTFGVRPAVGQLWPRGVCGTSVSITVTDASLSFSFEASTEWLQTHSFGHNPYVEVINSDGVKVWADVTFPSISQVRVQFSEPVAGTLILS